MNAHSAKVSSYFSSTFVIISISGITVFHGLKKHASLLLTFFICSSIMLYPVENIVEKENSLKNKTIKYNTIFNLKLSNYTNTSFILAAPPDLRLVTYFYEMTPRTGKRHLTPYRTMICRIARVTRVKKWSIYNWTMIDYLPTFNRNSITNWPTMFQLGIVTDRVACP